jgi:signal transduction histidine kinase
MSSGARSDSPSGERLEQLVLASVALTTEPSLEGVMNRVVHVAAEVIEAQYAAIGVLAPDGRTLESFTTRGIDPEARARLGAPPKGHGILGLVIKEAKPIRLPDLTKHPDSYGFPPNHPRMNSFLGVPIVGRRGVFGNLYLTEKTGGRLFTDEDEYIAVLLATMCAAAVENARLHEESARLLEEVHQLHRTRERFFAMVNHELRNALAAVFGWSEMLVRKKDPASVPRAAFEVLDSAEQAIGLINDLLDLSRLDEDRLKPVIRAVEPGAIARRAVGRVTPAADAKGISVNLEIAPTLPSVETDASRVEQILINLLGNAIKHAPDKSTVLARISAAGRTIVYRVDDEGPGIAESESERIFDIYVTRDDGQKQGIGLGLPLSRRLARLLGGELRVLPRNQATARGACFELELPAHPGS